MKPPAVPVEGGRPLGIWVGSVPGVVVGVWPIENSSVCGLDGPSSKVAGLPPSSEIDAMPKVLATQPYSVTCVP